MKKIILMSCWPRSGGTLLNKILVGSSEVLVFSEINLKYKSDNEKYTIRWQLINWYGIHPPQNIKSDIDLLTFIAEFTGKLIIIRNFDYIDFTPNFYNNYKPNNRHNNAEILSKKFRVIHFAFIRKPIDTYKSMITSSHKIEDENFIYYRRYINSLIKNSIKMFSFEDLCSREVFLIKKLFVFIGLKFNLKLLINLNNERVLGDISINNNSRAFDKSKIVLLRRKQTTKILNKKILIILKDISDIINDYMDEVV